MHPELRDLHDVSVQLNQLVTEMMVKYDKNSARELPFCESFIVHSAARSARLGCGLTTLVGKRQTDAAITLLRPQFEAQLNYLYALARGQHGNGCICSAETNLGDWLPGYEKKLSLVDDDPRSIGTLRLLSKQGKAPNFVGLGREVIEAARKDFVSFMNAAVHSEHAIMKGCMSRGLSDGGGDETACRVVFLSVQLQRLNGNVLEYLATGERNRIESFAERNSSAMTNLRDGCCC